MIASVLLLCLLCHSHAYQLSGAIGQKRPFQRLPTNVVPKHYDILLWPDLVKFTFSGQEVIEIVIRNETRTIVMNALELDVNSAQFISSSGVSIPSQKIELNAEDELLTISFAQPLHPGAGSLQLVFNGTLNDKMKGFYRSKYMIIGQERYAATTQFESTGTSIF